MLQEPAVAAKVLLYNLLRSEIIQMSNNNEILERLTTEAYEYGFVTDIAMDIAPIGLSEDIVKFISAKKNEPEWLLEWRLKGLRHFQKSEMPHWQNFKMPDIDFQSISYYAAPKKNNKYNNLDEVDPELLATFEKLGIPLSEQKMLTGVAVDVVFDSVSVTTTFKEKLNELGIIFCSFSEAVREHPELVKKYLGTVVPYTDNVFAALNAAVVSDGSFAYIPKGVRCPMELSTYFRINAENTGQFERTLIIADEGSYVSYLEGCTAPMRDENQLHAAVVELIALDNAEIKYSTVQNWYPGDKEGNGGIYNFVTKRGICKGVNSKISWTQVETGSAITWKYPSVILRGDNSTGEFYNNSYRGLVQVGSGAENARNFTQCDSLLIGDECGAHTFPYIESKNSSAIVEHEATTSKIGEDQIFYLNQRGIDTEKAVALIVNGYAKEVLNQLPMEFAVEAQKLLAISLEGSVG